MERIVLNPKEERRLLKGHLWVYRSEFAERPPLADGEVCEVATSFGKRVGFGFFQATGGIAVRLLGFGDFTVDDEFLAGRIERARSFRERLYGGSQTYRWVFGESDGLPGLVADRYGAVVVAQTQCAFYERMVEPVAQAFLAADGVAGVHFTGPGGVRTFGALPERVECECDGGRFLVDPAHGQKTGLFLDQRENWQTLAPWCNGAEVLDGCCYTGAWSLRAARYGAKRVLGVDTSAPALELAREQARLNGVEDVCAFEASTVETAFRAGAQYDVVVLDPPALAKARAHVVKALGRYQVLNRDALRCVRPGGVLITCSCSHFVAPEQFLETLKRAAGAAKRSARLLELRGAARDHPVLLAMPETVYLKCAVLQVE